MAPKSSSSSKAKPPPPEPHLKTGSRVEISSNDDGFRGSWFLGTVIRRASTKNPSKYLVQYETLCSDSAGKKPLREILDQAQLRPVAPREKQRIFKFGEEVDAYHNDGWWEGAITEDCGHGKFNVFFRSSREQILFGEEDLRLHREWINGEWKPPLEDIGEDVVMVEEEEDKKEGPDASEVSKEVQDEHKFNMGDPVEVSSDEEGFKGAWFTATVVKVMKNKYLVEYKTLRTEDDTAFLEEEVDNLHIRPSPPETVTIDRFKLQDEVDAFYNEGWWVGIIIKVLADSKYTVYFKDSEEEIVFEHSQLRIHQDWIGGRWIMNSQKFNL